MNKTYQLIWNAAQQAWIVTSELGKTRKKSSGKAFKLALWVAAGLSAGAAYATPAANTLPTGESVAVGTATFDRSVINQLTVNQSGNKLITNWNSFDVGSAAQVVFVQPDAASIALNRVASGSASEIFGRVTANGQLAIVNPNGITFGAGSQVNAASLVASALDIQDTDFNAGNYLFSRGVSTGSIDNHGRLTATAGSVALLAPTVKNSGSIIATTGHVGLVNADTVNLSANLPAISQFSSITGLVKNSGSITATQLGAVGGKILLVGDTSQAGSSIALTGSLNALETEVNANQINIAGVLDINGTQHVLKLNSLQPYTLSSSGAVNLHAASSGFSVNGTAYTVIHDVNQLQSMDSNLAGRYVLANNIDASDTVNWNSGAGFAPIGNMSNTFNGIIDGLGHTVNQLTINLPSTDYIGLIGYAQNSSIQNIGLINNSITGRNVVGGLVGKSYAISGSATISNSYTTGSVMGRRVIGGLVGNSEIEYGSTSSITNSYTTGNVIGKSEYVGGLVGVHTASDNGSVSSITNSYATGNVTGNDSYVGGLLGRNLSQLGGTTRIINSYATGRVTGAKGYVGGLVAENDTVNGAITNSYSTGDVTGSINYSYIGGLVAYNTTPANGKSSITSSYATGNIAGGAAVGGLIGHNSASGQSIIANSYATGSVTGTTFSGMIGGLVGSYSAYNGSASLTNNYATGNVNGQGSVGGVVGSLGVGDGITVNISNNYATGSITGSESVGGLIGYILVKNSTTAHITNNYATGSITGSANVGGLVGSNSGADIDKGYWDTQTTGQNSAVGINSGGTLTNLTGLTTAESFDQSSYGHFDFNDTWFMAEGSSRPMLRSFLNTADADGKIAIGNLYQLQGMAANLSGNYYLTQDIDASATATSVAAGNLAKHSDVWGGRGFAPIGNDITPFTGTLNGSGYVVEGLNINRAATDYVGLIGNGQASTVQNIGLNSASVNGQYRIGGLMGSNRGGSVLNSYVTGSVNGNYMVGGLVGDNYGNATISNSYSTSSVNGGGAIGGLVGNNYYNSVISNSYASGNVMGNSNVGGLAGYNEGNTTISNSYASGSVTGNSNVGGLIGTNIQATAVNSYWNTSSTGQANAIGSMLGNNTLSNLIGLSNAESKQLASYANWGNDIDAQAGTGSIWRIYEGQTAPLLRSFLKQVNVTIGSDIKTYDGTAYHVTGGSYTLSDSAATLLGGVSYGGGTAEGARNAGTYSLTGDGLYSTQQGYDISYSDGTLTINKAALSISSSDVSKTYDGTTTAPGNAIVVNATQLFGSDSLTGGTFAFDNKNAGTGKTVKVSGVSVSDGNNGNNYSVSYVDNTNSSINKRLLTISATAANKVYDGKLTAGTDKPLVTGRQRGDSITGLSQSFLDKNVGTGKTVRVNSGYVISDGNGGNNYHVVLMADNVNGVITPRNLTISTVANTKVYDGGLRSTNKPQVTGLASGDRITGLYQQYETKTVGDAKKLLIKNGYVVNDGNGGSNYIVTEQTSNDGVITAH